MNKFQRELYKEFVKVEIEEALRDEGLPVNAYIISLTARAMIPEDKRRRILGAQDAAKYVAKILTPKRRWQRRVILTKERE